MNNPLGIYINQVMEKDGYRKQGLNVYPPIETEKVGVFFYNTDFWERTNNLFETFKEKENAFAQYFLGVFSYNNYMNNPLNNEERIEQEAHYLKLASDQYYIRAINFLLNDKKLMKQGKISSEDLGEKN